MKKSISLAASVVAALFVGGCSSNVDTNGLAQYEGIFVDSAVGGIEWSCGEGALVNSGTTGADGKFGPCPQTGTVEFSIGKTSLGSFTTSSQASAIVTPNSIDQAAPSNDTAAKIAILLQSLDSDGDPTNGITIPTTAAAELDKENPDGLGITDNSITTSDVDTVVTNVVAELVVANPAMVVVTEADATAHLADTEQKVVDGNITAPDPLPDYTGATN